MNTDVILTIFMFVVGLGIGIATRCLNTYLEERLSLTKYEKLRKDVEDGVRLAEKLYKAGSIQKDERTSQVFKYLNKLEDLYDPMIVKDLIEAFVLDLPKTHPDETTEQESEE